MKCLRLDRDSMLLVNRHWNYSDSVCSVPHLEKEGGDVVVCSCDKDGAFALVWIEDVPEVGGGEEESAWPFLPNVLNHCDYLGAGAF